MEAFDGTFALVFNKMKNDNNFFSSLKKNKILKKNVFYRVFFQALFFFRKKNVFFLKKNVLKKNTVDLYSTPMQILVDNTRLCPRAR